MPQSLKNKINIDGKQYSSLLIRNKWATPEAVRIIIPAYQPNTNAKGILKACIKSIQKFSVDIPYELWVVDNCSPRRFSKWLITWPDINIILIKNESRPKEKRSMFSKLLFWQGQERWGSYANAVGLMAGLKAIDSSSMYIMTLHMDTLATSTNWLPYLMSNISNKIKAAGGCLEKTRSKEGVLHVSWCLVDYPFFRKLDVDLLPQLPKIDVGDNITHKLREEGYDIFACKNTYEEPSLKTKMLAGTPYAALNVAHFFDDNGNVIFLHLGRGIPKANSEYKGSASSADEWLLFADEHLGITV